MDGNGQQYGYTHKTVVDSLNIKSEANIGYCKMYRSENSCLCMSVPDKQNGYCIMPQCDGMCTKQNINFYLEDYERKTNKDKSDLKSYPANLNQYPYYKNMEPESKLNNNNLPRHLLKNNTIYSDVGCIEYASKIRNPNGNYDFPKNGINTSKCIEMNPYIQNAVESKPPINHEVDIRNKYPRTESTYKDKIIVNVLPEHTTSLVVSRTAVPSSSCNNNLYVAPPFFTVDKFVNREQNPQKQTQQTSNSQFYNGNIYNNQREQHSNMSFQQHKPLENPTVQKGSNPLPNDKNHMRINLHESPDIELNFKQNSPLPIKRAVYDYEKEYIYSSERIKNPNPYGRNIPNDHIKIETKPLPLPIHKPNGEEMIKVESNQNQYKYSDYKNCAYSPQESRKQDMGIVDVRYMQYQRNPMVDAYAVRQSPTLVPTTSKNMNRTVRKPNYRELINHVHHMRNSTSEDDLNMQIIKRTLNYSQPLAKDIQNPPQFVSKLPHQVFRENENNTYSRVPVSNGFEVPRIESSTRHFEVSNKTILGSPLDLSLKTVKTKADSTEKRTNCNPVVIDSGCPLKFNFKPNFHENRNFESKIHENKISKDANKCMPNHFTTESGLTIKRASSSSNLDSKSLPLPIKPEVQESFAFVNRKQEEPTLKRKIPFDFEDSDKQYNKKLYFNRSYNFNKKEIPEAPVSSDPSKKIVKISESIFKIESLVPQIEIKPGNQLQINADKNEIITKSEPIDPQISPIDIKPNVSSIIAARIRTKAELKGFTFYEEEKCICQKPISSCVCNLIKPTEPKIELDLNLWSDACNQFVDQLIKVRKNPRETKEQKLCERKLTQTFENDTEKNVIASHIKEENLGSDFEEKLDEKEVDKQMDSGISYNLEEKADSKDIDTTFKTEEHVDSSSFKLGKKDNTKMMDILLNESEKDILPSCKLETKCVADNLLKEKEMVDSSICKLKEKEDIKIVSEILKNEEKLDSTVSIAPEDVKCNDNILKNGEKNNLKISNLSNKDQNVSVKSGLADSSKSEFSKNQKENILEDIKPLENQINANESPRKIESRRLSEPATKEHRTKTKNKTKNTTNHDTSSMDLTKVSVVRIKRENYDAKSYNQCDKNVKLKRRNGEDILSEKNDKKPPSKRGRPAKQIGRTFPSINKSILRKKNVPLEHGTRRKRQNIKNTNENIESTLSTIKMRLRHRRMQNKKQQCIQKNKKVNELKKQKNKIHRMQKTKENESDNTDKLYLEVYRYKRALKIPPNLITIKTPRTHKISASLPDLDVEQNDIKEIKKEPTTNNSHNDFKVEEMPKSIIDVLHSRVVKSKGQMKCTQKYTKSDQKASKTMTNQQCNSSKLNFEPPTFDESSNSSNNHREHRNVFETQVLSSRTRREYKMQLNKETIREIFGDGERPASAPPEMSNVANNFAFAFEEQANKFFQFPSGNEIKQEPVEQELNLGKCIQENLNELKCLIEKNSNEEERLKNKIESGMTNKCRRKRNGRPYRRKFSSGFDYLRKRKKPNPNALHRYPYFKTRIENSETESNLQFKDETDVLKEIQKWVLNKGVGQSVLHKAARLGYIDVVVYCLEKMGLNPDHKDNAGYTPLHDACVNGSLDIARVLLQYGANHSEGAHSGIRPIHEASENGHIEIVRMLLAYGADPLLETYSGQTPLMLAEDTDMDELISKHLADVQMGDISRKPWSFPGPWKIYDKTDSGYDALSDNSSLDTLDGRLSFRNNHYPRKDVHFYRSKKMNAILNAEEAKLMSSQNSSLKNDVCEVEIYVDAANADGELFEFEESSAPLPPLYLLKDEGIDKWVLLSDLCNLLKVKSKDTLLHKIFPSISPATVSRAFIRELKMCEFLEKATCLQLLCAGEKINICHSKVVLIKYNENVRNLLGVKTIFMKF